MWRLRLAGGNGPVAAMLAAALLALGGCSVGRILSAPAADPQPADLIVALGGGGEDRVRTALALYREGFAPRILLTGFPAASMGASPPEGSRRARILIDGGVPPSDILYDDHARDSCEEGIVTRAIMKRHGWRRALVISDPPHLHRLDWAWSRVFADSGMSYRLVAAASPWWHEDWWRDQRSSDFALSEVVKFAYYVLVRGCPGRNN